MRSRGVPQWRVTASTLRRLDPRPPGKPRSRRNYPLDLRSRARLERIAYDRGQRIDELRTGVERLRAAQLDSMLPREGHRLHVDVIQDFEVVGDESDRAHQGTTHTRSCQ